MAIPEPRAARAAARAGVDGHAAIKRVTVIGYRSATPRPATRRPAAARASAGAAQNSTNPAAATPVHASIKTLWSRTRPMMIADIPRTAAMPTRKSDASAGAWLSEAWSHAMNADA